MVSLSSCCRFCAETKPNYLLKDLRTDEITRNLVIEKLSSFREMFVDFHNKSLPECMCVECFEALESCHEFVGKVKRSQEVLGELADNKNDLEINVELSALSEKEDSDCGLEDVPGAIWSDESEVDDEEARPVERDADGSWAEYSWSCGHCAAALPSMDALREHSKSAHTTCFGFKCADCDARPPPSFSDFVAHVRTHRENLRKICEYCNIKMEDCNHTETHLEEHSCTFCGEIFKDETLLLLHLTVYMTKPTGLLAFGTEICDGTLQDLPEGPINNWSDYPCICKFCRVKFIDRGMLNDHCMLVHGTCFGMGCAHCDETQNTYKDFVEHVHKHQPSLEAICPYCQSNMGFYDTNHIDQHKTEGRMCILCGEVFKNYRHLRRHHDSIKPNPLLKPPIKRRKGPLTEKDFTCNICGKVMKNTLSLKAHKTVHTRREKEYTCEICGKGFYTKGCLNSHTKIHSEQSPETCKICNKTFKTLLRLRKHVITHNLDQPFTCDHCKRMFSSKQRIREHMKSHLDIMPYECVYCQKRFRFKSLLNTHTNQHTGARPYSCDTCSMDFTNWSNCNKHMKRKHGTTLAKNAMTPHGKIALNPHTGKPDELSISNSVKEWSKKLLITRNEKSKLAKKD